MEQDVLLPLIKITCSLKSGQPVLSAHYLQTATELKKISTIKIIILIIDVIFLGFFEFYLLFFCEKRNRLIKNIENLLFQS